MFAALPMRILIQNCDTGSYFKEPNAWTVEPGEASDFPSTVRAAEAHRKQHLKHVRIVLKFSDSTMDISLPLKDGA